MIKLIIYIIFPLLLCGCAAVSGSVTKIKDGVKFEGSKNCSLKYKDKEIEAEFDSKGQPLINIGDMPDVKMK